MFKVSILTIGSEILDGRILNSNAQYFGRILNINNIGVQESLSCDDDIDLICESLEFLFRRVDYVITSGGLGPTSDDLTRNAVAKFTNKKLYEDLILLEQIKDWYKVKNRTFIELNAVQAQIPLGSAHIYNKNGTAPGFITKFSKGKIACLPGIPRELFPMFEEHILPDLKKDNPDKNDFFSSSIQLFGIPESLLGTKVNALNLPKETKVIYQVQFPELRVVLINENEEDNRTALNQVIEAVGQDFIVSHSNKNLSETLNELLYKEQISLSVAESCSGGYLSNTITNNSGSSEYFKGSVICYSNDAKSEQLDVSSDTLKKYGAISKQTVDELLAGLSNKFKTTAAIAIVGVAGPNQSEDKPVGTVIIGVKLKDLIFIKEYSWNYSREQIKQFATSQSLDILRRMILELPY